MLDKHIGIDKTVIKNFTVERVDYEKLLNIINADKVVCMRNMKKKFNYFEEERKDNFNTIIINDDIEFNTLKVDVKKIGVDTFVKYAYLDWSIRELDSHNLIPLTTKAYQRQLERLFKYIRERYGLEMNTDNVKFDKVELNATIKLNDKFKEYIRAIDIMCSLAPKTYRDYLTNKTKKDNSIDYFLLRNKSMECKFYNKSKQMEEVYNLDIDENALRIEYTLNNTKIKDVFGTDEIKNINDDEIKRFVREQFKKDFINRYNKHKIESIKKITKIAKELQKESKQWVKSLIIKVLDTEISTKVPLLIDVEHLKVVLKERDKHNYSRNVKKLEKDLPNSFIGIEEKLEEIFKKMEEI